MTEQVLEVPSPTALRDALETAVVRDILCAKQDGVAWITMIRPPQEKRGQGGGHAFVERRPVDFRKFRK